MKKLSVLIGTLFLLGSAAVAIAGPWGMGPGMGMGPGSGMGMGFGMNPYVAANLDLTPDQSAKLQALREADVKEIAPLRDQLFSKRQEMRLLWSEAAPDQAKIAAKLGEVTAIQNQIQQGMIQYQLDCRKVLTPEQQEKLSTLGPWSGRGPGPGWGRRGW